MKLFFLEIFLLKYRDISVIIFILLRFVENGPPTKQSTYSCFSTSSC